MLLPEGVALGTVGLGLVNGRMAENEIPLGQIRQHDAERQCQCACHVGIETPGHEPTDQEDDTTINEYPAQYEPAQQTVVGISEYELSLRLETEQNSYYRGQQICQLISDSSEQEERVNKITETCIEQTNQDEPDGVNYFSIGAEGKKKIHTLWWPV